MKIRIKEKEEKNLGTWELMSRPMVRDLEKAGIKKGKELIRPDGQSTKIDVIEYDPDRHCVYLITEENEYLPSGKIVELVKQGILTVK